jgi:hypothetical protein
MTHNIIKSLLFSASLSKVHRTFFTLALGAMLLASCEKVNEDNGNIDEPAQTETTGPFDANGASKALFSVAANKQVRISRGNLQYQASTDSWRFAGRQYEVVGSANNHVSPSNEGWIDCFGWGTSGWESGANACQPWSVSIDDADYQPGGSWQNGLTGDYANADWGVYNAISNGGNQAGMWRTLTNVEWAYLFGGGSRPSKWGRATLDGRYKGLILLPDEWTAPDGISFTPAHNGFNTNAYTMEQWECLEAAGAIFLPAAGYRQYTFFNYENQYGVYWSVSPYGAEYPDCALGLLFNDSMLYPSDGEGRSNGFSVRLVQDK